MLTISILDHGGGTTIGFNRMNDLADTNPSDQVCDLPIVAGACCSTTEPRLDPHDVVDEKCERLVRPRGLI